MIPTNVYDTAQAMLIVLKNGGMGSGGLNFDAKRRRNSTDDEDLLHRPHRWDGQLRLGLEIAQKIIDDGLFDDFITARYSSFDSGEGKRFAEGKMSFAELAEYGKKAKIEKRSGKQEYLNNLLNSYLFG